MPRNPRNTQPVSLDWRPRSYWDHADPVSAILVNVKGAVRRKALRAALEGHAPDLPVEPLMREELPEAERRAWGKFHPQCMGGEYLPGYLPGEVEIARIVFASVTGDVVSIRARRRRGGKCIRYRVVDEYPEDRRFICRPQTSTLPLSLGAIRELVWNLRTDDTRRDEGFIAECLRLNIDNGGEGPESMDGFIGVESVIYPELGAFAAQSIDEFLAAAYPPELEEGGEEAEDEPLGGGLQISSRGQAPRYVEMRPE